MYCDPILSNFHQFKKDETKVESLQDWKEKAEVLTHKSAAFEARKSVDTC